MKLLIHSVMWTYLGPKVDGLFAKNSVVAKEVVDGFGTHPCKHDIYIYIYICYIRSFSKFRIN